MAREVTMRRILAFVVISGLSVIATGAQTKAPVTRADYGQWESIGAAGPRGGFSPDGQWLAYALSRSSRNNELRFLKIADGTTKVAAFGTQPSFSADSKWAAYSLGYSEAEQERMRTERRPIQNKLGLLNLSNGETSTLDGVQSFSFSADGSFLAMRRYPPTPAGEGRGGGGAAAPTPPTGTPGAGAGAAAADDEPTGATLIIRELASGTDTTFGNISEYAWQTDERTHLLALAISAEGKSGNGVHLFDPKTTVLRVLDSSAANYLGLSWRQKSADLAVLRAKADEKKTGSTHVTLAWRQLGSSSEKRVELDPASGRWRAGRYAHRLVPPAVLVRRRQGGLRRPREVGRQAGDTGAGPRRWRITGQRDGLGQHDAPSNGSGRIHAVPAAGWRFEHHGRGRRARGRGHLALERRGRHGEAEAHRHRRSPAELSLCVASGFESLRAARQELDRAGLADDAAERRVRRGVGHVRDGSVDWTPGFRSLSWSILPPARGRRSKIASTTGTRRSARRAGTCCFSKTITTGRSTSRRAAFATSRKPPRRRSSIASRTPPSNKNPRLALPAGRKTTPRWCCTTSSISGRWRRTDRARRG